MWVFLPVMCLMLLLICIIDIIKRHQNQRLGSFANKFHQLKQYNGELLDAIKERSCARRDADVQHLAAVQSLEAAAGTQLKEHVDVIKSCYPEEIVQYYSPAYPAQLLEKLEVGA